MQNIVQTIATHAINSLKLRYALNRRRERKNTNAQKEESIFNMLWSSVFFYAQVEQMDDINYGIVKNAVAAKHK